MRKLFAAFSFLIFAGVAACDQPGGVATIEEVDTLVAKLDEAFEARDAKAIQALMTPDHVAVTPYYDAPLSVAEQIASLPDLKYEQTNLSEPAVIALGPDVAMRTLTAKLDGTYKGVPIPKGRMFIISIVVRQDGEWLERFYQVTALQP